nr:hypothetical protein [Vibrio sp. T20]
MMKLMALILVVLLLLSENFVDSIANCR